MHTTDEVILAGEGVQLGLLTAGRCRWDGLVAVLEPLVTKRGLPRVLTREVADEFHEFR